MKAPHERYEPRGAAVALLESQAPEVLLSGPAGTGKSLACLYKIHLCAAKHPGFRGLVIRKTRESLSESALATFERDVLGPNHPLAAGARREGRKSYDYPGGSSVVVAGLRQAGRDMTQKVFSTDYDLIYVQEAIELTEEEWENLTTRLRGGTFPYKQLLADTNPSAPTHWLKRRCDGGKTLLLESRHEDNPRYHNGKTWTPEGEEYLARLDALTGPRRQRLRFGRWVQAEGVVYEGYDPALHLIDRPDIPRGWPRLWSIDFGFTNAFVWQAWAIDPDGRLYRYRELYRTRGLVEDHAARIRELARGDPPPAVVVCDHDAEDRATLERHLGVPTRPASKEVLAGIQAVAERLRRAGDGRPRLYLVRDSLDGRDPELEARKLPCCTEEEFDGYVWADASAPGKKEGPIKINDHGMDALRYAVMAADHMDLYWRPTEDPESRSMVSQLEDKGIWLT